MHLHVIDWRRAVLCWMAMCCKKAFLPDDPVFFLPEAAALVPLCCAKNSGLIEMNEEAAFFLDLMQAV